MPMPARWIWGLLLAHFCQCLRCLLQRSPDSDDEINLTKVGCHQKYAALEGRLFFPDSSGCSFDCFAGIGWLHEHASTLEECDVQNACAKSLCILHVLYMTVFSHRIRLYYICSHPKKTIHLKSLETFMHAFTCMFMVLGYFIKYCIERAAARILFANWGPPCRVLVGECQRMVLGLFPPVPMLLGLNKQCLFRSRFGWKEHLQEASSLFGGANPWFSDIFSFSKSIDAW